MEPKRLVDEHCCHAFGCEQAVEPKLFMCRAHWYSLPKAMRDAIWAAYRHGQEVDKLPSNAYLIAARTAQVWLARKEGHHKYADFREKLAREEAVEDSGVSNTVSGDTDNGQGSNDNTSTIH